MSNLRLLAGAQDFGKLGDIHAIRNMSWAKIPTYYYDIRRLCFPLTAAETSANFGGVVPVFNVDSEPNPDRDSNAAVGSGVNEIFIAMGAGVVAMGEGEAFTVHGVSVTPPTVSTTVPSVQAIADPTCEGYCGSVDLSGAPAAAQHATLWWGAPTWRVIDKFFQSYRLKVKINARFEIVDESLFDVGMVPTPPEFVGASDSRIPTMPFIRAVNTIMASKSIANTFVPANVRTIGGESVCLPPVNAEVTYGHPRIIGLANRIYCFNQPILFLPGMRFEVEFSPSPGLDLTTDACSVFANTAQVNCLTPDALYTATVAGVDEACGISCTIPGGSLNLGVVFKGFALWPQAALQYVAEMMSPGSVMAGMLCDNPYLTGLVSKYPGDVAGKAQGVLSSKPLSSG